MLRTLDRYVLREMAPSFAISLVVFTFVVLLDRIYQLSDLVIAKGVPFHLVVGLLALLFRRTPT